jgi:MFS family permease
MGESNRKERLFRRRYKVPILLAIAIAAFNQLSGINAILYYLNDNFVSAGFSRVSGNLQAVIMGTVNFAATLIAMMLIDKVGRKTLLLIGCVGMVLCLSGAAAILSGGQYRSLLVVCLTGYIAFFALSSGAVVWVYMGEIFPTRVRVKGQALGSTVLWLVNGVISQVFPSFATKSPSLPFVFFAAVMAAQFVITLFFFPETKGLSLEELQRKLRLDEV